MATYKVITGLSGAGKSTAVKLFEDIGYFCVDNLPPGLMPPMVELIEGSGEIERVAFVVDVREGVFFDAALEAIADLKRRVPGTEIVFLESSDETLLRRYSETKRRHPLAADGDLSGAIARERHMLRPLREAADVVIDTTTYNVYRLREVLRDLFDRTEPAKLTLTVLSFGYKWGVPPEADLVFDVRFIANPRYVEGLADKTGLDSEVNSFIMGYEESGEFIRRVVELLEFLVPLYEKEGKAYLTVAFGCTGGVHRSVAVASVVAARLARFNPTLRHRDIYRA